MSLAVNLFLVTLGITVLSIDAHVNGTIFVIDKNLAFQKVTINGTNCVVSEARYQQFNQHYLPLDQHNPPLTIGNLIVTIANDAIVFINYTESGIDYISKNLQCTPSVLVGPIPSGGVYGLCPNTLISVRPSDNPEYLTLRRTPNTNGTLLIGPAPNYALHYVTGNNAELFIKNFYDGISSSVPVPVCSFVRNVTLVSNNRVAIFCASNTSTPSIVTSIHFRNLTVDHYVSINLTRPITEPTIIVRSFAYIVVVADGRFLHVINRVSGNSSHVNTNGHIADILIVNTTLTYYITTQLTQFSPLEILKGSSPPAQKQRIACGPPSCAFITSVNKEVVLYSMNNKSLVIKARDTIYKVIPLDIAPQFLIHDLTYNPEQKSPSPPQKHSKELPLIVGCTIVGFMLLAIVAGVVITLVILIVIKKQCRSSKCRSWTCQLWKCQSCNNSKYPIEESEQTDSRVSPSIQEQGQSVQESNTGGHAESC